MTKKLSYLSRQVLRILRDVGVETVWLETDPEFGEQIFGYVKRTGSGGWLSPVELLDYVGLHQFSDDWEDLTPWRREQVLIFASELPKLVRAFNGVPELEADRGVVISHPRRAEGTLRLLSRSRGS